MLSCDCSFYNTTNVSFFCRPQTYERQFRMPEQREGGLLQLLGDHTPPKHQLRGSLPPAHTLSHTQQTQHILTQQFQHAHQHQINPDWIASTVPSASPANPADSEPGASRSSLLDPTQAFSRTATGSPSPQRSLTPDLQLPVVTDASILNLTSLSRYDLFSCVLDVIDVITSQTFALIMNI